MNRKPRKSRIGALLSAVAVFAVAAAAGAGVFLAVTSTGDGPSEVKPVVTAPVAYVEEEDDRPAGAGVAAETATGADAATSLLSAADVRRFERLQRTLGGSVGVAIAPLGDGPLKSLGKLRRGAAWSTMKVPVVVTLIRDRDGLDGLSSQERAWARAALTRSDNDAAKSLFAALERARGGLAGASDELESTLRAAGDKRTQINTKPNPNGFTTFGQTSWTAGESARFYRQLARGCLMERDANKYVLGLMRQVVADQRWGMGRARLNGAPVALKGGWGPGPGGAYLVRQSAVVGSGHRGYVISILARADDGSFGSGIRLVDRVADWAAGAVEPRVDRPAVGCD
jgi:beta-lactamase class A